MLTLGRINRWLFSRGQMVTLPGGAHLFVPSDDHFFGFVLGRHEQHIADVLLAAVKPGDTCMDVGANIGYFTAIMARLAGKSGKVFSFEPVPETFVVLKRNSEIAAAEGASVTAINAAVTERSGPIRIVRREHSTYHQVEPSPGPTGAEMIPGVCLDEELARMGIDGSISFLKIDVEGHELPVLRGLQRSVRERRIARLVVEVTPGPGAVEINDILSSLPSRTKCWLRGEWRPEKITALAERTDVYVEFMSS